MFKFSIIIPVYNVEKYLEKCLESVLAQKGKDYEIILINDGSTDSSGAICKKYSSDNINIKYINKINGGLSDARNAGILKATGEYLIFIDSDDWIMEDSFDEIRKIIVKEKPEIIINRIVNYSEETMEIRECNYEFSKLKNKNSKADEIFENCYNMDDFWGAAWTFVVNREYLIREKLFFMKGIFHEDEEWSPRVMLNAKKISFNNMCFYCYRVNRIGAITQKLNIKKEFDKLKIIEKLLIEAKMNQYNENQKKCIKKRCTQLYVGIIKNIKIYKKNKEYSDLKKQVTCRKEILKLNNKVKYKIIRILINIIGIEGVSKIIC